MQGAIPTQSHTTGSQGPLLISNIDVGSFTSHMNRSVKVLWDGTCGFSSLSEKTRKSNHLLEKEKIVGMKIKPQT